MLHVVGNVLIFGTTFLAWAFVVQYHLTAQWWKTEMGRNVMSYSLVVAAVLGLSVVRLVLGDSVGFQWLRSAVFAGVPVVIGWRMWILWKTQHRD